MEKNEFGFLRDRYVWIILCISMMVRIYMNCFTYVMKNDSVVFIQNAHYFAHGDFEAGLRHDYHPLYSMMVAGMYKIVPDMELSGAIISVFWGTLTVLIFYMIGRVVFGKKLSFISSLILAFHPYAVRYSADIISESTYFFFFLSALGFGFFALNNGRLLLYFLTGIFSAFAYLARPEGIGIIFIVSGWCFLKGCVKTKRAWKETAVKILILVVSFAVFSLPYLVYIKSETGSWHLTKKKSVSKIAGIEKMFEGVDDVRHNGEIHEDKKGKINVEQTDFAPDHQLSVRWKSVKSYVDGIFFVMEKYFSTFHPLLFVLFLLGMAYWGKIERERLFGRYVLTIILFYLFILIRLSLTHGVYLGEDVNYTSRRHVMPIIIPALFWVGIGITVVGTWLYKRIQKGNLGVGLRTLIGENEKMVLLVVLIIVVGILLPKTLKSQRLDKIGIVKVGRWIRENSGKKEPVIFSTSARNAYYAGGRAVQMRNLSSVLSMARKENADYIMLTQREHMVLEKELKQSIMDHQTALVFTVQDRDTPSQNVFFLYKVLY